jgi:hypothetical protein
MVMKETKKRVHLLRVGYADRGRAQSHSSVWQFRSSDLDSVPLALLQVIIMRLSFLSIIFVLFGLAAA